MQMSDETKHPRNPYAPPTVDASMAAADERGTITFEGTDRLPKICLRCGVKRGVKRRPLRLEWISPVAYLWLVLGLLPYLIARLVMQRTAQVQLPFCDPCNVAWSNRTLARGALIAAGAVLAIVTLAVGLNGAPMVGGALAVASIAGILFARQRLLSLLRPRLGRIDRSGMVVLDGVSGVAAAAIAAMYEDEGE
jgi:hypothetical protein